MLDDQTEMKTVNFIQMKDGTKEEYEFLDVLEEEFVSKTADRVLKALEGLKHSISGYKVTRYDHSLQSATLAHRDGADIDWVVAALLHDIGDELAPCNHDSIAEAVIKPYVREEVSWVIRHHGIFQMVYYAHHLGKDPEARQKYKDSPHYQAAVDFCERWDQRAFDPDLEQLPLSFFRADGTRGFCPQGVVRRSPQAGRPGAALQELTFTHGP